MHLISLGHSCQTRFIIDKLDDTGRRTPFDFNITTRPALIRALATDGASLQHDEGSAEIFRTAADGRTGIHVGGFYFWHDYPLAQDKLALADGWQREIPRVNEKYAALWSRLSALLRSDAPKTLLLSNSQHNLGGFAADEQDFRTSFGLGRPAFEQIARALDTHGARNWRLLMLTRAIADLAETAEIDDPRLDHRFVGVLSLRPNPVVSASLAVAGDDGSIAALAGTYCDGAWTIGPRQNGTALIRRRTEAGHLPHGAITRSGDKSMLWVEGRRDTFSEVSIEDGHIRFSDGTIWIRDNSEY